MNSELMGKVVECRHGHKGIVIEEVIVDGNEIIRIQEEDKKIYSCKKKEIEKVVE